MLGKRIQSYSNTFITMQNKLWNTRKHNQCAAEAPPGTEGLLTVSQGTFLTHSVPLYLAGHLKFSCNLPCHSHKLPPSLPGCTLPHDSFSLTGLERLRGLSKHQDPLPILRHHVGLRCIFYPHSKHARVKSPYSLPKMNESRLVFKEYAL